MAPPPRWTPAPSSGAGWASTDSTLTSSWSTRVGTPCRWTSSLRRRPRTARAPARPHPGGESLAQAEALARAVPDEKRRRDGGAGHETRRGGPAGAAPRLPRRPAERLHPAADAGAGGAGRPDRAVRAQGRPPSATLADQRLRPVGRGARQEACQLDGRAGAHRARGPTGRRTCSHCWRRCSAGARTESSPGDALWHHADEIPRADESQRVEHSSQRPPDRRRPPELHEGGAALARPRGATAPSTPRLVHTGQHYDDNMSDVFFRDLGLPEPDHQPRRRQRQPRRADGPRDDGLRARRDARSGPTWSRSWSATSTRPSPCALVCAKLGMRTVHLEAGLRSFDRTHARGDQPPGDRRARGPAVDAVAGRRREPAPRRHPRRANRARRQHHDRLLRAAAAAHRGRRHACASLASSHRALRRGDPAPAVQRGRPRHARAAGGVAGRGWRREMPLVFPVHPRTRKNLRDSACSPRSRRRRACGCASPSATCSS